MTFDPASDGSDGCNRTSFEKALAAAFGGFRLTGPKECWLRDTTGDYFKNARPRIDTEIIATVVRSFSGGLVKGGNRRYFGESRTKTWRLG